MHNILAIDTCTEVLSVCLYADGKKYARFIQGVEKSSGLVLNYCNEVLKEAGVEKSSIDLVCYTKGPGSFTGVRMCVGVAQGISYANDIPTFGISTLEVFGYGASKKFAANKVFVALDARMSEVYCGVYKDNKLKSEELKRPNEVDSLTSEYIGVGTGWGAYTQDLIDTTGISNYHSDFYPMAENMIDIVLTYVNDNNTFDSKLPLPTYLRNNVAKKSLK